MNQAVNRCDGHHGIRKDLLPLTKGLIGGNQEAFTLVAMGDKFKQDSGFGFRFADIANIINQEQIEGIEFFQQGGQLELQFGLLQLLN